MTSIISIIVAIISVGGTVVVGTRSNKTDAESTYAEHMPEMWDRLDKITAERDDLKDRVIILSNQVTQLTAQTESQSEQIQQQSTIIMDLQNKIEKLTIFVEGKGNY